MTRRKMHYYRFNGDAENVIEAGKPLYSQIRGNWNESFFNNPNPIILELACGKGEYSIGLGKVFSDKNFIGMDIKGDRIARGSAVASEMGLSNVGFLRAGIRYAREFFEQHELSEIWLVHPDPQVRDRDENKRLTNPDFLNMYADFIRPGGMFHLKTDSDFLYDYSLDMLGKSGRFCVVEHTADLYQSHLVGEHHGVQTHYEHIFTKKGYSIKYIKAKLL
ncbi:tRNA (guanosine(46)-N7)-methyltransferase TrmB [Dyadobacter arcticus]|uniref:tRNA (guanine-N(7)-)-methyltransferase n=1 Tax=Dyadobacter arcticus TaxID=1078754 RepID=A0ABX0UNV3_9BACT|nr:tRNA (guanosine(46)-N7)-methyltransferase TrmB [Dyadobacter arcticus]NIJ54133.1 tRNA (guanine-N7-)-methyltransferase [Dyadobacter arcticus]